MNNKEILFYFAIAIVIFMTVTVIVSGVVGREAIKLEAARELEKKTVGDIIQDIKTATTS